MASFHDPELATEQQANHVISSSDSSRVNYAVAAIPIADSRSSSYAPLHFELSEGNQSNGRESNLNKISIRWRFISLFLITISFILLLPAIIQPHWSNASFQMMNIAEFRLNMGLWKICVKSHILLFSAPIENEFCTEFTTEMLQSCFNKESNPFMIGPPSRGGSSNGPGSMIPNVTDSEASFCGLLVTARGFSTTALILSGLATVTAGTLAYFTFGRSITPRTMFYHKCFILFGAITTAIGQIGLLTGIYATTTSANKIDESRRESLNTQFTPDYSIILYSFGLTSLFIGTISHVFLYRKIQRALIADTNPNGMDGYIN